MSLTHPNQKKSVRCFYTGLFLLFFLSWVLAWCFVLNQSFNQTLDSSANELTQHSASLEHTTHTYNLSTATSTITLSHPSYPHHHAAQFVMGSPVPHLIWFAGTREGASDVLLLHSLYINQQWTTPQVLLTRAQLEKQLGMYIKKLGNAVGAYDPNGTFHLWVTHVSLGGWASARIAHLTSKNPTFSNSKPLVFDTAQNLNLSGFLNISYLVRHPPIIQNNQFVLPIYHELYNKYPALLWQSFDGTITKLNNITQAKSYFQGALIQDPLIKEPQNTWWLYLRPRGFQDSTKQNVVALVSHDLGNTWSEINNNIGKTKLQNPNSGIAALAINNQHILVSNTGVNNRSQLVFAVGSAPSQLTNILEIANAKDSASNKPEFSYPALYEHEGSLWLAYTQDRQRIVVKEFK